MDHRGLDERAANLSRSTARALIRHEGRPSAMKLAAIALTVTCLLAGCDSSTSTPQPPAPAVSPAAQVDASAPATGVQAPPSAGEPAPSVSAEPGPTPTPDPEAVRTAAAAQYLAAALANTQGFAALATKRKRTGRDDAEIWGQFAADLKQLQVPADTAADLHELIRRIRKVQALRLEEAGHFARMADFYVVARHLSNAQNRLSDAVDRVRSDLDLPALCKTGCPEPPPLG
jgi:hypothetical protein